MSEVAQYPSSVEGKKLSFQNFVFSESLKNYIEIKAFSVERKCKVFFVRDLTKSD